MRAENLPKYLYGSLSFFCMLCIFQLLPLSARAQGYNFSGVWNFNSFLSGPGAPWWQRGTITADSSGAFTGSATQNNSTTYSISGSFSVPSNGIVLSLNGQSSTAQCMTDASNSILSCTATLSDGSSNLIILTRQASSITASGLSGAWEGSVLSSEPNSSWQRVSETVNADGTYTGTYTKSDGTTGVTAGTLSISSQGVVKCVSGDCMDPTYGAFINSTGAVMVGTRGGATTSQDANLIVFTKQPASFSIGSMAGVWEVSGLASGPGAPWWQNGILVINTDGTCSFSGTASDGKTTNSQNGAVSISSSGLITLSLDKTAVGSIDPNMDVMVLTSTWPDGTTHAISILTNAYSYAAAGSPVVTYGAPGNPPSTEPGSPPGTVPGSPPGTVPGAPPGTTPGAPPTSNSPTPQSNGVPHAPGAAGSLKGVSETNQKAQAMTSAPPAAAGGSSAPGYAPGAGSPADLQRAPGIGQASRPATAPGQPTIVSVTPGDSEALVSFKLPSHDGGQPITKCTVTTDPGGIKTTRAGSPIQVSDLKPGTSYTFKVTAANEHGTGPASQTSKAVTPAGRPGAPQIVAVTPESGEAQISFKAPSSSGGSNIISYTVTSSSGQKATGPSSPITVTGLRSGAPCTFTVTATNKTGTGPPSRDSTSVTPR